MKLEVERLESNFYIFNYVLIKILMIFLMFWRNFRVFKYDPAKGLFKVKIFGKMQGTKEDFCLSHVNSQSSEEMFQFWLKWTKSVASALVLAKLISLICSV